MATEVKVLPAPEPLKAIRFSDMPRYVKNIDGPLPKEILAIAEEVSRLAMQGSSFGAIAGCLGFLPDEFRQLCLAYPDLKRAIAYGVGVGSDHMTKKLFQKGAEEGDMAAISLWLRARGGFEPPKLDTKNSVSVKSGDVTVSIDLDRLRNMAAEQSNLIEGIDI